jgi:hypothetical protein
MEPGEVDLSRGNRNKKAGSDERKPAPGFMALFFIAITARAARQSREANYFCPVHRVHDIDAWVEIPPAP